MPGRRHLCSHLVRVRVEGSAQDPETAVLEEIDEFGVVFGAERAYPAGAAVRLLAEGLDAPAFISNSLSRETDYAVSAEFRDDYRWTSASWRPDHLFDPRAGRKSKAAGQS